MPFFSILIPVYNVEPYVEACLNSVIKQKFTDYEIIIIDDGSTDKSLELINKYQDRFKQCLIKHRENKGIFATRLEEIELATGQYLLFLDSDDSIAENMLQELYECIQKNQSDLVIYGNYLTNESGIIIDSHLGFLEKKCYTGEERYLLFQKILSTYDVSVVWQKCVSTRLLKKETISLRQYAGINMGDDKIFSSLILSKYKVCSFLNLPLYYFRKNSNSLTAEIKPKYVKDFLSVRKAMFTCIEGSLGGEEKTRVCRLFFETYNRGIIWYCYKMILNENVSKSEYSMLYDELTHSELHKSVDFMSVRILFRKCIIVLLQPNLFPFWRKCLSWKNAGGKLNE